MILNSNFISIGVVFRNEARHLPSFFTGLEKALSKGLQFEILGYDNQSIDESSEVFKNECLMRKWSVRVQKSPRNNMGQARDWILKNSLTELVYFIDVDVTPDTLTIQNLVRALNATASDPLICAAAGPLNVKVTNEFQNRLASLQQSWWGNFGSAQMKSSFSASYISHAPTAQLLVKRLAYLNAGSFNSALDCSGEDLEIHWRLCKLKNKILWVKDASAIHEVADSLRSWLKKSIKYGIAQTQIARLHPSFFFTIKCLPVWLFLLALFLLGESPQIFCILFLIYIVSIVFTALRLQPRNFLYLTGLLFCTHLFYLFGEIFGLLRSPAAPTNP